MFKIVSCKGRNNQGSSSPLKKCMKKQFDFCLSIPKPPAMVALLLLVLDALFRSRAGARESRCCRQIAARPIEI